MATEAPSQTQVTARPSLARSVLRSIDPHVADTLLAVVLCVGGFAFVLLGSRLSPGFHRPSAVGVVLLLVVSLPLVAVRSHPWIVFALIAGASVLGAVVNQPAINAGYFCGAIALFFVASRSDIWRGLMAGMLASITLIAIFALLLYRGDATIWLGVASWFAFSAVWLAGVVLHAYRENVGEA